MNYTIKSMHVEREYCDEFETVLSINVAREDGTTGEVWLVAGVPPYLQGTSRACGHEGNLRSVRVYGDSPEYWCPDSFDPSEADGIIAAVEGAVLAKDAEVRYAC